MKKNFRRHLVVTILFGSAKIFAATESETKITGRMNAWGLYETNDFASTTVALVYDSTNTFLGVAVGPDKAVCFTPGRHCTYRQIGADGNESELQLDKITGTTGSPTSESQNTMGSDLYLLNFGLNTTIEKDSFLARINGNFTRSFANTQALYGSEKYRPQFTDAYVQYEKSHYRIALGRKAVMAGVIVDGVDADYLFGPDLSPDAKTIGFFAGYAADPISKYPGGDYITFGPTFRFIPDYSSQGDAKLRLESSLVSELYRGEANRFYLYSMAHFTPIRKFSLLGLSNLDLPGFGKDDTGLKSSHFTLQSFWHPQNEWFVSFGFSQLRIDRYLEDAAVRWVTDQGSTQNLRVGQSLDRSQRYRFDVRTSYRPEHYLQPYIRARYERRTFDSDKVFNNVPLGSTSPGTKNTSVLGRRDAYQATLGTRLFFYDDRLETDSAFTYNQRFQSDGYDFYQAVTWDSGEYWTVDTYGQWLKSHRTIANSDPSNPGYSASATDYYAGIGGSLRFLSNFLLQIRYDFSSEDDMALGESTIFHTVLCRVDYSF